MPTTPMPSNSRHSIHNLLNSNSSDPPTTAPTTTMPTATTQTGRKRGAADISSDSASPTDVGPSTPKRRRSTQQEQPASSGSRASPIDIEEIDLATEGNVLQETLQKQRAEQVKAQAPQSDKPATLGTLTCVICMDSPTDLTATSCGEFGFFQFLEMIEQKADTTIGHLFCHTCLIEALKAGEKNRRPGEAKRSQCPVCRKNLDRNKPNDIIPLLIKKKKNQTRQAAVAS